MNNTQYICDTNIWVKICLGKLINNLFEKYPGTSFVDFVENEIVKWNSSDDKFQNIATEFSAFKSEKFHVIYFKDLDEITKSLIKRDLKEYFGVNIDLVDNKHKKIENLGEQASLIYAYHLDIPYIQSEDNNFFDQSFISEKFEDIKIISWSHIISRIIPDDMKRIKLNRAIEEQQEVMNKRKIKFKEGQAMEVKLAQLQKRYSNR